LEGKEPEEILWCEKCCEEYVYNIEKSDFHIGIIQLYDDGDYLKAEISDLPFFMCDGTFNRTIRPSSIAYQIFTCEKK